MRIAESEKIVKEESSTLRAAAHHTQSSPTFTSTSKLRCTVPQEMKMALQPTGAGHVHCQKAGYWALGAGWGLQPVEPLLSTAAVQSAEVPLLAASWCVAASKKSGSQVPLMAL